MPAFNQVIESLNKQTAFIQSTISSLGLNGLEMDATLSQSINANSETTDKRLENGSVITVHVNNLPLSIEMEGIVSSVNYKQTTRQEVSNIIRDAVVSLDMAVGLSNSTRRAIKEIVNRKSNAKEIIDSSTSLFGNIASKIPIDPDLKISKGIIANRYLLALRDTKQPLLLQTKLGVFNNLILTSVESIYNDDQSNVISFRLSFKQIYFAESIDGTASITNKVVNKKFKENVGLGSGNTEIINQGDESIAYTFMKSI